MVWLRDCKAICCLTLETLRLQQSVNSISLARMAFLHKNKTSAISTFFSVLFFSYFFLRFFLFNVKHLRFCAKCSLIVIFLFSFFFHKELLLNSCFSFRFFNPKYNKFYLLFIYLLFLCVFFFFYFDSFLHNIQFLSS